KMGKVKISNNELKILGIEDTRLLADFSREANRLLRHRTMSKVQIINHLAKLIADPEPFLSSDIGKFRELAQQVSDVKHRGGFEISQSREIPLKTEAARYPIFGAEHIEAGALAQMETAMQLPVSIAGALMPDAHQGYGLPIGGVLATSPNTIIPFA